MVLHDIADRPYLLVKAPAAGDAEVLSHRDLHALHVVPIPDQLEERVGEAKVEEILDRLLPEVVIDTKDRRLGEDPAQSAVERLG